MEALRAPATPVRPGPAVGLAFHARSLVGALGIAAVVGAFAVTAAVVDPTCRIGAAGLVLDGLAPSTPEPFGTVGAS